MRTNKTSSFVFVRGKDVNIFLWEILLTFGSMFLIGCSFPSRFGLFSLLFGRWTCRRSDLLDLILKRKRHWLMIVLLSWKILNYIKKINIALTCLLWSFYALCHFSIFPSLVPLEASSCPEPRERTARGNPDKWHAATSEDLSESFCPTNVVDPVRLNKAPGN